MLFRSRQSDWSSDVCSSDLFNKKQSESAEVAAWTDQTVHRMKGIIHTFLIDAGLVVEENGKDYIKRLQLNRRLRQLFINKGQQILVDSLTGEN